ncbi:hypothetical protein HPB47_018322, partial [Ixodes persulcatus]
WLGHLDEFDPDRVEAWPPYQERLNCFFTVHNIVEGSPKMRSVCGPTIYTVICSSCVLLTAHFTPCLSVIVQCFAFHKRSQQPGETIANFVITLCRFSEHCNFGETLSDMLWNRLRRPLGKPTVEFKKAFEAANPSPP